MSAMTKQHSTIEIYDTTLRDGSQAEDVSFSVEDKVRITLKLDELGVHFIEGGWPGANPKDIEFFQIIKATPLQQAKIVAFGSTRKCACNCWHGCAMIRRCAPAWKRPKPMLRRVACCPRWRRRGWLIRLSQPRRKGNSLWARIPAKHAACGLTGTRNPRNSREPNSRPCHIGRVKAV